MNTKKMEGLREKILNSGIVPVAIFLSLLLIHTQGFCDNTSAADDMDKMATSISGTIFASWVRKIILTFGFGIGGYSSVMAGSPKPFLAGAAIGLIYNFIPNIVDFVTSIKL